MKGKIRVGAAAMVDNRSLTFYTCFFSNNYPNLYPNPYPKSTPAPFHYTKQTPILYSTTNPNSTPNLNVNPTQNPLRADIAQRKNIRTICNFPSLISVANITDFSCF